MRSFSQLFSLTRLRRAVASLLTVALLAIPGVPVAKADEAPAPTEAPPSAADPGSPLPSLPHSGEIIVRFSQVASAEQVGLLAAGLSASHEQKGPDLHVIRPADSQSLEEAVRTLRADPSVAYAEPNYLFRAAATSDPRFGEQWALLETQAEGGWAKGATILGGAAAAPVTVAVVDTGVDTAHEDLADRLVPGWNSITGANPGDLSDHSADGHGTHAAGLIAAAADNGLGIAGLGGSYPIRIMPVKALDSAGIGSMLDIANGIRWAADNGAQVINLSFGARLPDYPLTLAEAVQYAQDRGALVVAAAGNEGLAVDGYYPASLPGVVSAAATGRDNRPAIFTNLGQVYAPGLDVLSTLPGNQYGSLTGTSVAAAAVSGTAAVLRSVLPAKSQGEVAAALLRGHRYVYDGARQYQVLSMIVAMDALNNTGTPTSSRLEFEQPTESRITGTTRFVVRLAAPAPVDLVEFSVESATIGSQSIGSVVGTAESGLFELSWDSTNVPDGSYYIMAKGYNASNVQVAMGGMSVTVYNTVASGLTFRVVKPDGLPAAGASVQVFYAPESSGALAELFTGHADLNGNLSIPGTVATDGNQYLVVAQGSDPGFIYSRAVTAPALVTLDAAGAHEVVLSGRNGDGSPAGGATVWADVIAGPEYAPVRGVAPVATLPAEGMAKVHLSQGVYTFRQYSADFGEYQVRRGEIIGGPALLSIEPPAGGLSQLAVQPDGTFDTYGVVWTDEADSHVLAGPKSRSIAVTPGEYSARVKAEAKRTWVYQFDFAVKPFAVTAGESRTIAFGGQLQLELATKAASEVAPGQQVEFSATVTDAHGNRVDESSKSPQLYVNGGQVYGWPYWTVSPYMAPGTYEVLAQWDAGPLGPSSSPYIQSQPLSFTVGGSGGTRTEPLIVTLISKQGMPWAYGAEVTLLKQEAGAYTKVATQRTDDKGKVYFGASLVDPSAAHALLVTGSGQTSPTTGGSIALVETLPTWEGQLQHTVDLRQVALSPVALQAKGGFGQPLGGLSFYTYMVDAAGKLIGGKLNSYSGFGESLWVPQGRYVFQGVMASGGYSYGDQYFLVSPVVDVAAGGTSVVLGGSGNLTRLSVTAAKSGLTAAGLGLFPEGLPGIFVPKLSASTPVYVSGGQFTAEVLMVRQDAGSNWFYWMARAVTASGGELTWQVDNQFAVQATTARSAYETGSTFATTHRVTDGQGNRLVHMALGAAYGGYIAAEELTVGDPSDIAPFLVIADSLGEEVYRQKQPAAPAAQQRWNCTDYNGCPSLLPADSSSSFFGYSLAVPSDWSGRQFTATVELGAGPEGPVRSAPVAFAVGDAPILDTQPGYTREAGLTLTGTSLPGAAVTIAYTLNGGAMVEAGTVTAGDDGRFSLYVALADEGAYSFIATALVNGRASQPSAPLTVTVDRTAPGAPANLGWTSPDQEHILLTWEAPAETDIAVYQVWRDGTQVALVAELAYLDSGLEANKAYPYQVLAVDHAGNLSAPAAVNAITGTVADTEAPTAPANLTATVVERYSVDLTWEAATDNVAVTAYRIYRDGEQVAELTEGLSYRDSGLPSATTYAYTVTAVDAAGNESAPSAPASATTEQIAIDDLTARIRPLSRYGSALPGATAQVWLVGEPGRTAEATIRYQSWTDEAGALLEAPRELTLTLALTASPAAPGTYSGSVAMPLETAAVLEVTGKLSDTAGNFATRATTAGLPLAFVGSLQVTIPTPEGATVGDVLNAVRGGTLMVWSQSVASGAQLPVNESLSFTLEGLNPADDYQLRLLDASGRELAKADGVKVYGAYRNQAALVPALPATLQFLALDTDGRPKVSAYGSWNHPNYLPGHWGTLADGKSSTASGLWFGQTLTVTTDMPLPYLKRQTFTVTLKPGHNLVTVPLEKHAQGVLQGTVRAKDGTVLPGAFVSVQQTVAGATLTLTAKTDTEGRYSMVAYAGAASARATSSTNLLSMGSPLTVAVAAADTTTQDFTLSAKGTAKVTVDMYTRGADGQWQGPAALDWRAATHYGLRVVTQYSSYSQYPFSVPAFEGEVVKVCAFGRETRLPDTCAETTVGPDMTAHVELRIDGAAVSPVNLLPVDDATGEPIAYLYGTLHKADVPGAYGTVVQSLAGGVTEFLLQEEGYYQVVLTGPNGSFGSKTFSVSLGRTSDVEVRLTKGVQFQGKPGNNMTVTQAEWGTGQRLDFRVDYANQGPAVRNAWLQFEIPVGTTLLLGSVRHNGMLTTSQTATGRKQQVWVGDLAAGATGTLHYSVSIADVNNQPAIPALAYMAYVVGDQPATEVVGTTMAVWKPVSVSAPATVNTQAFTVTGNAPIGATVTLYSGEAALASVDVTGGGRWAVPVTLPGAATLARNHTLRAEITDAVSGEVYSATTKVRYDPDAVIMTSLTIMRQADDGSYAKITLDTSTAIPTFPFVLVSGRPVKFEATFNEPERASNVLVSVPNMGTVTLAKGEDNVFRGELPKFTGMPGAIYTDYKSQPKPFAQSAMPSLADMRELLPPELFNSTIADFYSEGSLKEHGISTSGRLYMAFNVNGDTAKQITFHARTWEEMYEPTVYDRSRVAAGAPPIYGEYIDRRTDSVRIGGKLEQSGSGIGGFNSLSGAVAVTGFELIWSVAGPVADITTTVESAFGNLDTWDKVHALLDRATDCGDRYNYYLGQLQTINVQIGLTQLTSALFNVTGAIMVASGVGAVGGAAIWLAGWAVNKLQDWQTGKDLDRIAEAMANDPACNRTSKPPGDERVKPKWIMDPGGYVYEAVPENRLEGVTTTLYEKQADGTWLLWDSAWYGQQNPLTTNVEGLYAWDVPEGDWQVLYQKDGYLDAKSPVVHVPPPQTEVHQGLTSLAAPDLRQIAAGQDGAYLDVTFTQYMLASTLTGGTILVTTADGTPVEGTVTAVEPFTRTARFIPAEPLTVGAEYAVDVADMVQNYAGRPMTRSVVQRVTIPADVTPPAPVSAVAVVPGDGGLHLSWTNPTDADFSHVLLAWSVNGYGPWVMAHGNDYSLRGLTNGLTHSVKLVAVDQYGNQSEPVVVTGVPVDTTAPGPVTDAQVVAGPGSLAVLWSDPSATDLAKVRITWTGPAGETGLAEVAPGVQVFALAGLGDEQSFQFTLAPVDVAGNAGPAVDVAGTTPAPVFVRVLEAEVTAEPTKLEAASVTLLIGPDTFAVPAYLQVQRFLAPAQAAEKQLQPVSPAYSLSATALELERPVTMTVAYDPALVGKHDHRKLALYRQNETDATQWHYVGGSVNPGLAYVRAVVDQFGTYAVMLREVSYADLSGHGNQADVEVLLSRGVASGVSATEFRPEQAVTRAELAKLLVLTLLQDPNRSVVVLNPAVASFTDVAPSHPEYRYIETAAALGIIKGSNALFGPADSVTRQELAAALYQALAGNESTGSSLPYVDAAQIADWAKAPAGWAHGKGLMKGDESGRFNPGNQVTRAQAVVAVLKALEKMGLILETP